MRDFLKRLKASYKESETLSWRNVGDDALIAGLLFALAQAYDWDIWLLALTGFMVLIMVADIVIIRQQKREQGK
jgi:hypothetical protein